VNERAAADLGSMLAALSYDPSPAPSVRLFQRCLFCRGEFPPNALFGLVPPGEQLAYDPERGRIWSICARCRRWTLTPIEERSDAIDTLERAVTGRAVLLGSTPNVRLYHVEDIAIVRIGAAPLLERSAWRFGREILERATAFRSRRTRVRAAAAGALARVGETFGVLQLDRDWGPSGTADILRWSRFGSVAWDGRSACRHCNSVLHTLHFDATWWLHPRIESDVLVIGVPCTRCDPWSPVNVFDVAGDDALLLLRRVLAYQHVAGADEQGVRQASELIRHAGSPDRLVTRLATGRASLWRIGAMQTLAMEMALTHIAERRLLAARLADFEAEWRAEEEIARIIDDDLS
jgi:hypothetical protein